MHPTPDVRRAFELAAEGLTQTQIAERIGAGQTTVGRWLRQGADATLSSPMRQRASSGCPDRCPPRVGLLPRPYAYLLGQYLGDGTIAHTRRGVYRLFISCTTAYPVILDETRRAIQDVLHDIRQLFGVACTRLGVEWRRMNRTTISVARQDSVARLDTFVGPKS
jgi:transcriptional regulator with XRE-family HTH domain